MIIKFKNGKPSKRAQRRLEKVARLIENTPHFNMLCDRVSKHNSCGSAACVAGTMINLNPKRFGETSPYRGQLKPKMFEQSEYLNIPYWDWQSLCYNPITHDGRRVYLGSISKRSAVRAIRRLARTGKSTYPNSFACPVEW